MSEWKFHTTEIELDGKYRGSLLEQWYKNIERQRKKEKKIWKELYQKLLKAQ